MAISRDEIVTAAVRLLDESGLAALSLRKVAAALGVSAPTLYWHVADKRALLDLVAERFVAEHPGRPGPAPDEPWWEWLADQARARYRAFTAHRDAALVVAGNRPTTASLDQIEHTLGVLVGAGFTAAGAMDAVFGLGHYVLGAALEYQAEAARPSGVPDPAVLARLAELPLLHEAATTRTDTTGEATFEIGLAAMMRGLRQVGDP